MQDLIEAFEISRRDLLGNIDAREWKGPQGLVRKEILLAGRTKFTEVWARDAAFAVPALLALGRADVVRNTLEAFFDLQHDDGRFPRRLGGMSNAERNVRVGLRRWFGVHLSVRRQIRPEFLTAGPGLLWHRGRPKDVNSLLLLSTAAYEATAHDPEFVRARRPAIRRALAWLEAHEVDDLLVQHHFEDWEDHTQHQGHGLYTNVLYAQARREIAAMPEVWSDEERAALAAAAGRVERALDRFWLPQRGYYANFLEDGPDQPFSVPGNMLALTAGFASPERRARVVERLAAVVEEYGYVPITAPGYPLSRTHLLRRPFVGHYLSGRLMLPWLQLLAARAVAPDAPDLARRLLAQAAEPVVRYGRQVEALVEGRHRLRYFFTAPEDHFTWGSAALHEAWAAIEKVAPLPATPHPHAS